MDSPEPTRPEMVAADRGGKAEVGMDSEAEPITATLAQARYWQQIYREITAMEELVLARIHELMEGQSPEARREVELTNVPVVVSQVERFRQRLGYWTARIAELE